MSDDINPLAGRHYPGDPFRRQLPRPSIAQLIGDIERAQQALCDRLAELVRLRLGLRDAPRVSYRRLQDVATVVFVFAYGVQAPISLTGNTERESIEGICATLKHRLGDRLAGLQEDDHGGS